MPKVDIALLPLNDVFELPAQRLYDLFALVINDRSSALNGIKTWKRSNHRGFKKLSQTVNYVVSTEHPIKDENKVKPDKAKSGIYELIAHKHNPRLFFYYHRGYDPKTPDAHGIIVCVHTFDKNRDNDPEQDRAFKAAKGFMKLALQHLQDAPAPQAQIFKFPNFQKHKNR